MNKNTMMIIAVAAVAVIAVAAAALFLSGNGGNDDGKHDEKTYDDPLRVDTNVSMADLDALKASSLPIFGNADGDSAITRKDADLIRNMISKGTPLSSNPLADANRDGKITSEDAEIVEKMVKGEKARVWFMDQYDLVAGTNRLVEIHYPLSDVVTQNADMLLLTMMIDGDDKVAGYIANLDNYPNEFYKVTHNGKSKSLGNTARYIAAKDWEAIKNLDVELHKQEKEIGAVIVHSESSLGDYKDDILKAGLPLIYLRCTDPVYSMDAAVLLGALFGPGYAEKAVAYSNDCRKTIDDVSKAVAGIPDEQRERFIALCMICYVAQSESQYTNIGIQAGGKEMSGMAGNTSVRLQDVEAITKYNDKIDAILNCSTKDCANITPDVLWEDEGVRYLEKSTHYKDMVWLNMSMPIPCRVMYVAATFYPDIVSMDEADDYFQLTVDKYMPYLHKTVDDGRFDVRTDMFTVMTYQDYVDYKGGEAPDRPVVSDLSASSMASHFLGEMDFAGYSGVPFSLKDGSDDQEASLVPTSGKYYANYKLYEDAESVFKKTKAEYEKKIGTDSAMGGTYVKIPYDSGLTDGIGYYVNVPGKIGSMYYAGYVKECYVEIHLGKVPSLSEQDLKDILGSIWGTSGNVSAIEAAKKFDSSLLDGMLGAPYAILEGDDVSAKIGNTNEKSKDYYVKYDNSPEAAAAFESKKAEFIEKNGTAYMGGVRMAIPVCGFDDGAGFYGNTDRGFSMIQYVGVKDGCYASIYIRMNDAEFTQDSAEAIVKAVSASISAGGGA